MISVTDAALLTVAGGVAAFVNTAAGAGSLISLRALMFLGLPADVANGTNRLPVLVSSLTAAVRLKGAGMLPENAVTKSVIPTSMGAAIGSLAASYTPERAMRFALISVLVLVAVVTFRKAKPVEEERPPPRIDGKVTAGLFLSGLYAGFLQAGVGLVMLHTLTALARFDFVRANALKVTVVAWLSVVSLAIFFATGKVDLPMGLTMSVGAIVGSELGVRYALRAGEKLKVFVVIVDAVACVVLLAQSFGI
jgi:uncharacterized protein